MATKELNTEPAAPKKKFSPLKPSEVKLRESTNNDWRAIVPRGTARDDLLVSDLWSIVSANFLPLDLIRVVAEDRSYYAELLVIEAGRGYANIIELSFTNLPAIILSKDGIPPNHEIKHLGPDRLYVVQRLADGVILGEGFSSREAALAHLLSHASLR